MGKAILNSGLSFLRGRVGDLVFKHYGNKVVVTKVPRKSSKKRSPKQLKGQGRFALASAFAEKMREHPVHGPFYARRARRLGRNFRPVVIADFLAPPGISRVYRLKSGGPIVIDPTERGKVIGARVRLLGPRGKLIEAGRATSADGITWRYSERKAPREGEVRRIEVTARDRAGNTTVHRALLR